MNVIQTIRNNPVTTVAVLIVAGGIISTIVGGVLKNEDICFISTITTCGGGIGVFLGIEIDLWIGNVLKRRAAKKRALLNAHDITVRPRMKNQKKRALAAVRNAKEKKATAKRHQTLRIMGIYENTGITE